MLLNLRAPYGAISPKSFGNHILNGRVQSCNKASYPCHPTARKHFPVEAYVLQSCVTNNAQEAKWHENDALEVCSDMLKIR